MNMYLFLKKKEIEHNIEEFCVSFEPKLSANDKTLLTQINLHNNEPALTFNPSLSLDEHELAMS